MAVNNYPSLTTAGVVSTPYQKAVLILGDYLATNYSQSTIFHGSLKSLAYTIKSAAGDMRAVETGITSDLNHLFLSYFDSVTVQVRTKPMEDDYGRASGSLYEVEIFVEFVQNQVTYTLARALTVEGYLIKSIVEIKR